MAFVVGVFKINKKKKKLLIFKFENIKIRYIFKE